MQSKEVKKWQDEEALKWYQMIAPLLDEDLDETKRRQLREEIAARHEISKRSLYWYEAKYRQEAFDGLCPMKHEGDFVEVCQDMNIVSTLPEYIKPKNVGLMFISMESDKFFPYTQIDVVQFPSGLGGNDIIEKTFKGSIH